MKSFSYRGRAGGVAGINHSRIENNIVNVALQSIGSAAALLIVENRGIYLNNILDATLVIEGVSYNDRIVVSEAHESNDAIDSSMKDTMVYFLILAFSFPVVVFFIFKIAHVLSRLF